MQDRAIISKEQRAKSKEQRAKSKEQRAYYSIIVPASKRNLLEQLVYEFHKYGIYEVFWHVTAKFTRGKLRETAHLKMRDCYDAYGLAMLDYLKNLKYNHEELERYLSDLYFEKTGEVLDLKSPKNYNQKIQWLKIYDNQDIKGPLSDKFAVRDWIKEKIGEKYLIKLIGVWEKFDDIDFNALPEKFCLKPNHASGMNFVVRDKKTLNMKEVAREARRWMKLVYGLNGYEPQYFNIPPKIIAEEYIEQADGDLLDYKIHCFNSEPKIIQVIGGRDFKTHKAHEAFFDVDWNRNDLMYHTYDQYHEDKAPQKPENFDEMLDVARKLSDGFRYVRVDLYNLNNLIKFGEMTFTPADGFGKWASDESNKTVGDFINIIDLDIIDKN